MSDPSTGMDTRQGAQPPPGDVDARGETQERSASLWADAWRELYRSPVFVVSSMMVLAIISMAAFPTLWTDADPERCLLGLSLIHI